MHRQQRGIEMENSRRTIKEINDDIYVALRATRETWRDAVKRMIADEAKAAYLSAGNRPGKKHIPYKLSELAEALVFCLDKDDEHEAKRLMMIGRSGCLSLI